jgi:hypothetical protein
MYFDYIIAELSASIPPFPSEKAAHERAANGNEFLCSCFTEPAG